MVLPSLVIPGGIEAWELGKKENVATGKRALAPLDFGKFWVTDASSEQHLAGIRETLNKSMDSNGENVLHWVVQQGQSSEADELFRMLIGLGLDPEVADNNLYRPSHFCAGWARVEAARILCSCRPDVQAKNKYDHTPEEKARFFEEFEFERFAFFRGCIEVVDMWKEAASKGFPSIAELACKKEWAPLQNLCRRRALKPGEENDKFQEKTAIDWALFHGEDDLAKELSYLLKIPLTNDPQTVPLTAADAEAAASKATEMRKNFGKQFEATQEQMMVMLHGEVISVKTGGLEVQSKQIAELEKAMRSQEAKMDDLMSKVD